MPQVSPWHSNAPGIDVYHDNAACTEGNNIEKKHWTSGTGGKRKCSKCAEYDAAKK